MSQSKTGMSATHPGPAADASGLRRPAATLGSSSGNHMAQNSISRTGNSAGAAGGGVRKSGMDIDEALKRIALEKAQREASEKFLSGHLQSLQQYQDDVMTRWQDPSDFEKVDLVVAELLRNSGVTAALQYMERIQALVEAICNKLLPGAVKEGYIPQQHANSLRGNTQGGETQGAANGGAGRPITNAALPNPQMLQTTEAKLQTAEAELKALRMRLEQQTAKAMSLQNQLTEQRAKLGVMELEMKEGKVKLDKRQSELAATASRQAAKAAEMSSALVQVDARKRIEEQLREKLDGFSAELSVAQDALKKAEKANTQLRVKNTALEDQVRKEKREEVKDTIMAEMAQDQVWEMERELKSERHRNLKALKGKNKDIEGLQTRIRELEKELEERVTADAGAMAEGMTSRKTGHGTAKPLKGEPYTEKPFYWSFESSEEGEKQSKASARGGPRKSAKAGRRAAPSPTGAKTATGKATKVDIAFGSGAAKSDGAQQEPKEAEEAGVEDAA